MLGPAGIASDTFGSRRMSASVNSTLVGESRSTSCWQRAGRGKDDDARRRSLIIRWDSGGVAWSLALLLLFFVFRCCYLVLRFLCFRYVSLLFFAIISIYLSLSLSHNIYMYVYIHYNYFCISYVKGGTVMFFIQYYMSFYK